MNRLSLIAVTCVMTAGAVLAQNTPPPVIVGVSPESGPTAGGTRVSVNGRDLGLPPNFSCIAPCPAKVFFGDRSVAATVETNELLVVEAPPHPPGTVEVSVLTGDNRKSVVNGSYTYKSSAEAAYEKILIPVYLDGRVPGAYGSLWETRFAMRNNGTEPVRIAQWPCPDQGACPAVFPLTYTLLPGQTLLSIPPFFRPPTANRSRVLYLSTPYDVSANLRVLDASRALLDGGVELPIVRERDLLTRSAQLHGVFLHVGFRMTLRIYDLESREARFRVRLHGEEGDSLLKETEVTVSLAETGEFRTQAAYGEYSGFLEGVAVIPEGAGPFRLEVTPLTPGSRYWTFLAMTNNQTQRSTYVTPQ